jgi:uncharacterized protein YcgL (UPF0745 family)
LLGFGSSFTFSFEARQALVSEEKKKKRKKNKQQSFYLKVINEEESIQNAKKIRIVIADD